MLQYDEPSSNSAVKFNLRHYNVAVYGMSLEASREGDEMRAPYHYFHGRPLQLQPMKSMLKAPAA
jgi:hypothetical protein